MRRNSGKGELIHIQHSLREQVVSRAVILGAIAGACGYLGPIYLDPGAAQGPLFGIFFSGPLGAFLGAGLGLLFHRLSLSCWAREAIFSAVGLLLAAGVLLAVRPGDKPSGFLLDGDVVECGTGDARWDTAAKRWTDAGLKNPQIEQRPHWMADLARLRREDPGVVLTVKVWRRRESFVSKGNASGNQWKAGSWKSTNYNDVYFARYAGSSCSGYSTGRRAVYWIHVDEDMAFPPANASGFLSLFVIEPVPRELEPLSR